MVRQSYPRRADFATHHLQRCFGILLEAKSRSLAFSRLEGLLAGAGVEEEEVVEEFKQLRKQRRKGSAL